MPDVDITQFATQRVTLDITVRCDANGSFKYRLPERWNYRALLGCDELNQGVRVLSVVDVPVDEAHVREMLHGVDDAG